MTLQDNEIGNQSRFLHGQSITACKLWRESNHGTLSLQLLEGKKELFKQRIDESADTIYYHEPKGAGDK